MATLCRTEFLATEDLVVYFGNHLRQVVDLITGNVSWVDATPESKVVIRKPDGTLYDVAILPPVDAAFEVTVPVADYDQGKWTVTCLQNDGGVISDQDTIVASWGVTNTATVAANDARTQATLALQQATLARQVLTNKTEANSNATPTGLLVYDDAGTVVVATRTIANADGTPVSPAQVLNIGKLT